MTAFIENLGYLAGGSRLRRIYEHLQVQGDKVYKEAGFDFKSSWFPVFYILYKSDEPLSITAITNEISFTNITVKNIVRELEERQLVMVRTNPTDKRSKVVALSPAGHQLAKQLEPLWQAFAETVAEILTSGHPEILEILRNIDDAIDASPLNERMQQKLKMNID